MIDLYDLSHFTILNDKYPWVRGLNKFYFLGLIPEIDIFCRRFKQHRGNATLYFKLNFFGSITAVVCEKYNIPRDFDKQFEKYSKELEYNCSNKCGICGSINNVNGYNIQQQVKRKNHTYHYYVRICKDCKFLIRMGCYDSFL